MRQRKLRERWVNGVFLMATLSWKEGNELPSLPRQGTERRPNTMQGLDPTLQVLTLGTGILNQYSWIPWTEDTAWPQAALFMASKYGGWGSSLLA